MANKIRGRLLPCATDHQRHPLQGDKATKMSLSKKVAVQKEERVKVCVNG